VSQTGTDNILIIDNARAGNDQNRSSVIQNGTSNRATVIQIGDFNESLIRQIGDRNITAHTETGDFNRAESVQEGDDHGSAIRQRGLSNSAVVEQQGTRLRSQIAQGEDLSATEDFTFAQFYDTNLGATRSGNDNRVSVSQIGTDLSSTLRQRAAANSSASADNNNARIIQRGNGNSSSVAGEPRQHRRGVPVPGRQHDHAAQPDECHAGQQRRHLRQQSAVQQPRERFRSGTDQFEAPSARTASTTMPK
jgi:hypothetical protein